MWGRIGCGDGGLTAGIDSYGDIVDLRRWDQYRRYSPNVRDHLVPPDVPPDQLERELIALQRFRQVSKGLLPCGRVAWQANS